MYHIEVLPSSKDHATPGYAYVPDTGYDPSKAAIVPSGARKRARLTSAASGPDANSKDNTISARAASKIAKHIADLDRENHKDVQIVVPNKTRGTGATTGTRKILMSQKTWANYLADEEAGIALRGEGEGMMAGAAGREGLGRRESTVGAGGSAGGGRTRGTRGGEGKIDKRRRKSALKETETLEDDGDAGDVMDVDVDEKTAAAPTLLPSSTTTINFSTADPSTTLAPEDDSNDSLLATNVPPPPTPAEIQALLSVPPLSYNAARAAPTTSTAPPRKFCEMCGYWGRVMCVKCGARVCGLECKGMHDETRCLKFYA